NGGTRVGIAVGKLKSPDFAGRIWRFVRSVNNFKEVVSTGGLETADFQQQLEEFNRYSKEFSGKKRSLGSGQFEYVTYHGDIVQKLFEERRAQCANGESVFNSTLIDLFVKKDGVLTEVYEVKTGIGRQMLYTAIGQLLTHSTTGNGEVAKFLVIPANEDVPEDFTRALQSLAINVRRFRVQGSSRNPAIQLVD
ncbi:hypothetical protein, partial [Paracoccus sp. MC1862]|uniref:hypothetical protein n=1 Tax=Paracoccus sp. MC1862 TaxID=2760307 RepID=UPI00160201F8